MNRVTTTFALAAALLWMATVPVVANPLDPQVVAGEVAIEGVGTAGVTVHQGTDKAIIDWRSFDIGLGEGTHFVQPSASAVVLNRVTGGEGASQILGSLSADGQVFLINPDGILIGKDAIIDVGGLVASTHDIFDGDFLAGTYAFGLSGTSDASVINLGTITVADGGFAALVAPGVRNAGTITAKLGKVSLASASSFSLDLYGDSLITLGLNDQIAGQIIDLSTGKPLDALVGNDGLLNADGGRVQLTAAATRAVIDAVVNNSGVIAADSVGLRDGKIVLSAATADAVTADVPNQRVRVSGTLSATGADTGETGGKIEITGEEIELLLATLDAAGLNGGGTVLVGGNVGGRAPSWNGVENDDKFSEHSWVNATSVVVDHDSVIDASALHTGNAGKVIVWSDGSTAFEGTIGARGGSKSGNGGFVEVSGHERLAFKGRVDTSAPIGSSGTLLLDPQDVTIGTLGAWVIDPKAIESALSASNVLIFTNSSVAGHGDLTVAQDLSWASDNTLTLSAYRNLIVGNGVTIENAARGSLALFSGTEYLPLSASWKPTASGTVLFQGSGIVDWTGSQGGVQLGYNPSGGYENPTDFSSHVLMNSPVEPLALMWVRTATDVQAIASNLSGQYLISEVDMDSVADFVPIGSPGAPFEGKLFGVPPSNAVRGGVIKNLTIDTTAETAGLFGTIGPAGVVAGINILHSSVVGRTLGNSGVLAGQNHGLVTGVTATGQIEAQSRSSVVGGLVGWNVGLVIGSSADVDVFSHGRIITGNTNVGVDGQAGGLVGANSGSILESFALGDVTNLDATPADVGGLVGLNLGDVSKTYARGAVKSNLGNPSIYKNDVAGLIATQQQGTLEQSYSTGTVLGAGASTQSGGLIARNVFNDPISASYWDVLTSGKTTSAGGEGKATSELTSELPDGFDDDVWGIDPLYNEGYPYLLWERRDPLTYFVLEPRKGAIVIPPNDGSQHFKFVPLTLGREKQLLLVSNIPNWGSGMSANGVLSFPPPVGQVANLSQHPGEGNHDGYMANSFDFPATNGTPVLAIGRGKVIAYYNDVPDQDSDTSYEESKGVDRTGSLGNYITIEFENGKGGHFYATYAHLKQGSTTDQGLRLNATVEPGDIIGKVGSTGVRTGDHLHVQFGYVVGKQVRPLGRSRDDMLVAQSSSGAAPMSFEGSAFVLH